MNRGKFITLEGGEGVAKTTNIAFIEDYLSKLELPHISTREPGGTLLGEQIRDLLLTEQTDRVSDLTELLMMFAARAQHLENVILPALAEGQWVICDRFTDATYAYQGGGRGLDTAPIQQLENLVQMNFRPDLTILLDAPVDIGMTRALQRNNPDRIESEQMPFFKRVRAAYLTLAKQFPERIKVINADQSLDEIQKQIAAYLDLLIDR